MSTQKDKTKDLVLTSMFIALIIVMTMVPVIGYIPLGFMNATIIHIPVIIGAIVLGPKVGAILGLAFGISSVIKNTLTPNLTSFVFSPFIGGNWYSLIVSIVPRVLIGLVAYLVYALLKKKCNDGVALAVAGFLGSMTNTIFVMGGIYVFFGESYAAAKDISYNILFKTILTIVGTVGVPEAIVASVLTVPLCKVLFKVKK